MSTLGDPDVSGATQNGQSWSPDYIRYGLYTRLYPFWALRSVLRCADRFVSSHGLRPSNHFVCYIIIRQQDWRRPVYLVVIWLS